MPAGAGVEGPPEVVGPAGVVDPPVGPAEVEPPAAAVVPAAVVVGGPCAFVIATTTAAITAKTAKNFILRLI